VKQPEDVYTADWCETGNEGGGRMPEPRTLPSLAAMLAQRDQLADKIKRSKPRGAYAGAVKIGCDNHQARAKTGKSQAEFAALCGISERTLRTWERGDPVSLASDRAICAALASFKPAPHRPVRYYDQHTGQSWSGRGLMPAWMRAELGKGRRLADFERPAY